MESYKIHLGSISTRQLAKTERPYIKLRLEVPIAMNGAVANGGQGQALRCTSSRKFSVDHFSSPFT